MSETEKNLKEAFSGESQANRKYLAFAEKAEKEGFHGVGRLFRAAASGETVHALNHLNSLKVVKSTKENVQEAIQGESFENKEMYPKFIEQAKSEGNSDALVSFEWAKKVEEIHETMFKEALEFLEQGKDYDGAKYFYVCKKCGFVSKGKLPERCPICGFEDFMAIE